MSNFCYILAVLICVSRAYGQTNYCTYGADHTMCKYQQSGCTLGLSARGITQADITTILKGHNDFRNKLATGQQSGQPSASNMKEIKWDSDLATVAQRWADQCTFGHDANRRTAAYTWVGQNAALTGSSLDDRVPDFTKAITMWYNEVTSPGFDPKNISPFVFSSGNGHYTQVCWADTARIGCGFTSYKDGSWYRKLYICNYGPGGNIQSAVMYKTGTAASACLAGISTTYPGLCAS